MNDVKCRHCQKRLVNRPKGLCFPCYYAPGIRDLYPSTSKFAQRGNGLGWGNDQEPEPTDALPGTEDKVLVLQRRAALGQRLWSNRDAKR